ncbi:hypothetical protein DJICPGNB_22315 [Escherichia coli]|nr:hypothetical protein DJICPGNB_22315 [Escherichia coli]
MDTEISSVNTSFVGVVFPCITGVTDKESYKRQKGTSFMPGNTYGK